MFLGRHGDFGLISEQTQSPPHVSQVIFCPQSRPPVCGCGKDFKICSERFAGLCAAKIFFRAFTPEFDVSK